MVLETLVRQLELADVHGLIAEAGPLAVALAHLGDDFLGVVHIQDVVVALVPHVFRDCRAQVQDLGIPVAHQPEQQRA